MKTPPLLTRAVLVWLVLGLCLTAAAQIPDAIISERGPHHRVISKSTVIQLRNGRTRTNVTSYTELATGMHRWDPAGGQWRESSNEIELFQDGAVARKAPHQVIFAPNIAEPGSIDLQLPDGRRWLTHVEGLVLYDPATGRAEIIAEIKDCVGELRAPNTVVYADAFDTVRAAVRYTHNRDRFEQDVVLWERIDLPAAFGPQTRLEIWTELLEAPAAVKTVRQLGNLTDEFLDFGSMQIGTGHAFMLAAQQGRGWSVVMAKTVVTTEGGRTHLVEAVEYSSIQAKLITLPAPGQGAAIPRARPVRQMAFNAAGQRVFPARAAVPQNVGKIQMVATRPPSPPVEHKSPATSVALVLPAQRGLVLDYSIITANTNSFTFKGDSTYFISGNCTFSGTNYLEGGSCIKASNNATLTLTGPVECRTAPYNPAVFTSWCDNTLGETIAGSTGNPWTNYAAASAIYIEGYPSGTNTRLSNIRISHANVGLSYHIGPSHEAENVQVVHCGSAFAPYWTDLKLRNLLVVNCEKVFSGPDILTTTSRVEHATIKTASELNFQTNVSLFLTNCLMVAVTNMGEYNYTYVGANNASNTDPVAVFTTVGAGTAYLLDNTYRNLGTTNIQASLATDLRQGTTYPPTVLSGWVTIDTTLSPQVQRDTDAPDIGYHYDPLDYVWSGVVHSNATLTINAGTAIGITSWLYGYGLAQYEASTVVANGTPIGPVHIARYNSVQEQANTNWVGSGSAFLPSSWSTATPNAARFSFSEWTGPAGTGNHISGGNMNPATVAFWDSQLFGSGISSYRPAFAATNCLLHRVAFFADDDLGSFNLGLTFRHCTFNGGALALYHEAADTWTFRDNLFVGTDTTAVFAEVTNNFNGYVTNAVCSRLTPSAANNTITNAAPAYEAGALGRFYLPTNCAFIDTGSTNAHLLGFYHYTSLTNQTREATNRIDLGFHSVSLNGTTSGSIPLDGDADSFADYFEDLDGDGVADGNESDWTTYTSRYGIGPGPGLVVFTPLK